MIPDSAISSSQPANLLARTIRPLAAAAIEGIGFRENYLIALDSINGYILQVDPATNSTKILNSHNCSDFVDARGIATTKEHLWFAKNEDIYYCSWDNLTPQHFIRLPYGVDGIAVWNSSIYVTSQKAGCIFIFSKESGKQITRFYSPGIGRENIVVQGEKLWLCDDTEQTVYCLDRGTGEVVFNVLTPFENPTAIALQQDSHTGQETFYISYVHDEPYIRDNPNADPNYQLEFRDRTFVHPLYFYHNEKNGYALSNGYLVEMTYVEELAPLDELELELKDLEWRIALPADTQRQKIVSVEAVGLPFTEENHKGQRVAVFKFDSLKLTERHIFGWKAVLEVWGIKYQLKPKDCENLLELHPEFQELYLVDNDNLAMDKEIILQAATEAVKRETNLLRKMYSIRNYVYDKLSYGIKPHIDTPDVALARGVGSCGEYLGILLALARLNGIACRTVGRYKCPPHPHQKGVPLIPDYNHVWMEFYVPGFGWLPMESNPDDIQEGGPYPTRFFMGLAWYHAEMAKGVPFEKLYSQGVPVDKETVSLGQLAINHVQFEILKELSPVAGELGS